MKDKNLNISFNFFLLHLLHLVWHQVCSALSPECIYYPTAFLQCHYNQTPSPSAGSLQQAPNWPSIFHCCSSIAHLLCNSLMILLKGTSDITPVSSAMHSHCTYQRKKKQGGEARGRRLILGFKTQQELLAPTSVLLQTTHCACTW